MLHRSANGLMRPVVLRELSMNLVAPPLLSVQIVSERAPEAPPLPPPDAPVLPPPSFCSRAAALALEAVVCALYSLEILLCPRY